MSKDTFKCSCGNWEYRRNETFTSADPDSWPVCRQCAEEYFEHSEEKAREAKVLYGKYVVSKTTGVELDPGAKYFVLRYDKNSLDGHAREILLLYAMRSNLYALAEDIVKELKAIEQRQTEAAKKSLGKFRTQDE